MSHFNFHNVMPYRHNSVLLPQVPSCIISDYQNSYGASLCDAYSVKTEWLRYIELSAISGQSFGIYSKDVNNFRRTFLLHDWVYSGLSDLRSDEHALRCIIVRQQKACLQSCDIDKKAEFKHTYRSYFGEDVDLNIWSLLAPCHGMCKCNAVSSCTTVTND
jgi:hypothetical protein